MACVVLQVTWEDRVIEVGEGRVPGAGFLLSMPLDGRDIHSIAFASGPQHPAQWEILNHVSEYHNTPHSGRYCIPPYCHGWPISNTD
jgi:hypothetical protein